MALFIGRLMAYKLWGNINVGYLQAIYPELHK